MTRRRRCISSGAYLVIPEPVTYFPLSLWQTPEDHRRSPPPDDLQYRADNRHDTRCDGQSLCSLFFIVGEGIQRADLQRGHGPSPFCGAPLHRAETVAESLISVLEDADKCS